MNRGLDMTWQKRDISLLNRKYFKNINRSLIIQLSLYINVMMFECHHLLFMFSCSFILRETFHSDADWTRYTPFVKTTWP